MNASDDSRPSLYREYITTHSREVNVELQGRFQVIQSLLPVVKDSKILDIGCGDGAFLRVLESEGYTNGFGIDISEEQILKSKELGHVNTENVDVMSFLRFQENQWDCVVMVDVLEHFTHDEAVQLMTLASQALKHEGTWLVQVPNGESPFLGYYGFGDMTHRAMYNQFSLSQLARFVGLAPMGSHAVGVPRGGGVKRFARRVMSSVFHSFFKLALASETGTVRGHIVTLNLAFKAIKSSDKQ